MPVEIDVNLSAFEAMTDSRSIDRAQLLLTQRVADDFKLHAPAGHFVPRDTGTLQDTVEVSGKDEVTWPAEYAEDVYFGTEKMAGRPWFENGKAEQQENWAQYVGEVLTGGSE
nr:MAG TPA: Minor capsid protein [Caudoviricetes sp.]